MSHGRPVKEIDLIQLKDLMRLYPSLEETAGWFSCSVDTISRYIRTKEGMTFAEFRGRYMATTKLGLKRVAIARAMEGDSKMLTFCLKNLCGWTEKEHQPQIASDKSHDELIAEANALLRELS